MGEIRDKLETILARLAERANDVAGVRPALSG